MILSWRWVCLVVGRQFDDVTAHSLGAGSRKTNGRLVSARCKEPKSRLRSMTGGEAGGRGRSHLVKLPAALIGRRKVGRKEESWGFPWNGVCSFAVVTLAGLECEEPNARDPIKLLHFVVLSPEKDSRLDLRSYLVPGMPRISKHGQRCY